MDIGGIEGDRYHRVRLQVTGAEMFFGIAPIKGVRWPSYTGGRLDGDFASMLNSESAQSWDDPNRGIGIRCTYDSRMTNDPFEHRVSFAPVVEMTSREPLTTDQWLERWIRPLTGLGTLALGGRMSLAWLTVSAAPPEAEGAEILMHPNGVVFGSGILQKPFQASQPDDWRDPETQPLFTLQTMPAALPALLEHWATLETSANPFLELYRQTLWHNDLPARARYLYLIQALESLHTLEHRAHDEASHDRFRQKRADAIAR